MAGAQAGSAGRLTIEIVAEIARLQSDLDRAKRAVSAASGDIARSARAANDNLASIGRGAGAGMKSFAQDVQIATEYLSRLARASSDVATRINAMTGVTGGIRRSADDIAAYGLELDRLRGKYNPIFAATQQYRQSLEEIRRAHAVGAISADEMAAAISRERQQALSSIASLKGRTAALRDSEQAAQQAARAAQEAARQQAAYAAQAEALRAKLDPMVAAQQRFNTELMQAERLLSAGAISEREFGAAVDAASNQLREQQRVLSGVVQAEREAAQAAQQAAQAAQEAARARASDAAQFAALKAQIDPAWGAQQKYNQQVQLGIQAFKAGAIGRQQFITHMQQIHAELKNVTNPMEMVTHSAREQKQGMQQLSYQLNDVATQFAAGTPPMQIFAQQAGQTVQAVQLMGGGVGKLAAFLSGPWGMAVVAATVVLVPFIAKLAETAFGADKATKALDELIKKQREEQNSRLQVGQAEAGLSKARTELLALETKIARQRETNRRYGGADDAHLYSELKRYRELQQQIFEGGLAIRSAQRQEFNEQNSGLGQQIANQAKLAAATDAMSRAQAQNTIRVQAANDAFEKSAKTQADQLKFRQALTAAERDLGSAQAADSAAKAAASAAKSAASEAANRAEALAREAEATESLIAGLYKTADAYGVSTAAGMRARIEAEAMEKGIRRQADLAAYVERAQRKAIATQVAGTAEQVASMGDEAKAQEFVNKAVREGALLAEDASEALSNLAEQQKLQTAMSVASANSDAQGYAAAEKALTNLTEAQLRSIAARKEAQDLSQSAGTNRQIEDIERQTKLTRELGAARLAALRGLSGGALEDALANIAAAHEKIAIQARAESESARLLKLGYDDAAQAVLRKAEADKTQVDATAEIEKQIRAVEILNDRMNSLAGALANMDGIGGPVGDLLGVLTSRDPISSLLGMGGIGTIAGLMTGGGQEAYKKQAEVIAGGIKQVLPALSDRFAGTLASMIQGAGTGAMVAGIAGNGSQGSQLGGMVGGAFGQAGGEMLAKTITSAVGGSVGKFLGSAAGPLGAIAGGVLGSIFGGIFKKTPTGSVILGQGGIVGTSGNGGRDAGGLGSNVVQSLDQIAKALGATVGQYKVSIGMRGDSYKVDPTGRGRTKESDVLDFGQDAQAAVLAAVKDAIGDGVFQGLSDGVKKALETGDLETQLQKIAAFLAVPDQLAQMKDPSGYAAAQLEKELSGLRDIYAEMGASADQYSQLAEFEALKRAELVKQADTTNDALELERTRRGMEAELLRLSGDEIGALAATRQLEREQIAPSLQGLYDLIAARHDEIAAQQEVAAAAQAAAEIEKARVALRIEILEEQGRAEDALVLKRQQQRDATEAQLHSELTELFAAQDAAKEAAAAQQALTEATNAAAAAVQAEAEIEKARQSLRADLLEAEGRADEALTIRRMQQLAALDPLLWAEQQAVWSAERAAEAQRALADAQAASAAAADRISDLQKRLFTVQGNTAAVQQIERAQEMAGAQTEAERAMLRSIYAAEDLVSTQQKVAGAFNETASVIRRITDETAQMTKSLREFADSIFGQEELANPQAQYLDLVNKAAGGDMKALAKLPDAIGAYLGGAKDASSSLADYQLLAAHARQSAYGVADVADARASMEAINTVLSSKTFDPVTWQATGYELTETDNRWSQNAFDALQEELRQLREVVARGNEDRINLGVDQIVATRDGNRILADTAEGRYDA